MDKPKLTLVYGASCVGKTSIMRYLQQIYNYNNVDAGNPMKMLYANGALLGDIYLNNPDTVLQYMADNSATLLSNYEQSRDSNNRSAIIGLAEVPRTIYPDIWVSMAYKIGLKDIHQPCVANILNPTEYEIYKQHYEIKQIIYLDCQDNTIKTDDNRYLGDISPTHTIEYALRTSPLVTLYVARIIAEEINGYNANTATLFNIYKDIDEPFNVTYTPCSKF